MTIQLPPRIKSKKPRRDNRIRSAAHLKWIRGFACAVRGCVQMPIEAAHVRLGSNSGVGIKPDDSRTIPLCGGLEGHHAEQHRIGERAFAEKYGLDLEALWQALWAKSPARFNIEAKQRKAS